MMLISFDRFYAVFYTLLKTKDLPKAEVIDSNHLDPVFCVNATTKGHFQQVQFHPTLNLNVQVWPWDDPNDPTFGETYRILKIFHIIIFVILYALPQFYNWYQLFLNFP